VQSPTNDSEYTSRPIRLEAHGRVIRRAECWRPACRAEYDGYRTVLFTIRGKAVALCHRRIHDGFGVRVDAWKSDAA
jgi:hypothetical protein